MRRRFFILLFLVAALNVSGVSLAATLMVSAASSLTEVFKELRQQFELEYPSIRLTLNFGASGALLQQMSKGAPVDIFATADQETMNTAQKLGLLAANNRRDFARNKLVLIAPIANKIPLQRLEHLTKDSIQRIALGNPESVPVGRYAKRALEAAQLWNRLKSKWIMTQNAKQSLDYVSRGEVDAGFVFATDAALMKDKIKIVCEAPLDQAITYPIAQTAHSVRSQEGLLFLNFVTSSAGRAILSRYGFLLPESRS